MRKILLLDMDGTITPPRGQISQEMISCLLGACRRIEVGIVSGSDFDYIYEQCGRQFVESGIAASIILMPCNGTKVYKYDPDKGAYEQTYGVMMREQMIAGSFRKLLIEIIKAQAEILESTDISASGRFIADRGSTLNWCFIGRDCTKDERLRYSEREDKDSLRHSAIEMVKKNLSGKMVAQLEFALGGQTSIDIFPKGWDKTFALIHFPNYKSWFIGDKCEDGENDSHLYNLLSEFGRAFKTKSPEKTIEIIDMIVDDVISDLNVYKSFSKIEEDFFKSEPNYTNQQKCDEEVVTKRNVIKRIIDSIKDYWYN